MNISFKAQQMCTRGSINVAELQKGPERETLELMYINKDNLPSSKIAAKLWIEPCFVVLVGQECVFLHSVLVKAKAECNILGARKPMKECKQQVESPVRYHASRIHFTAATTGSMRSTKRDQTVVRHVERSQQGKGMNDLNDLSHQL